MLIWNRLQVHFLNILQRENYGMVLPLYPFIISSIQNVLSFVPCTYYLHVSLYQGFLHYVFYACLHKRQELRYIWSLKLQALQLRWSINKILSLLLHHLSTTIRSGCLYIEDLHFPPAAVQSVLLHYSNGFLSRNPGKNQLAVTQMLPPSRFGCRFFTHRTVCRNCCHMSATKKGHK